MFAKVFRVEQREKVVPSLNFEYFGATHRETGDGECGAVAVSRRDASWSTLAGSAEVWHTGDVCSLKLAQASLIQSKGYVGIQDHPHVFVGYRIVLVFGIIAVTDGRTCISREHTPSVKMGCRDHGSPFLPEHPDTSTLILLHAHE